MQSNGKATVTIANIICVYVLKMLNICIYCPSMYRKQHVACRSGMRVIRHGPREGRGRIMAVEEAGRDLTVSLDQPPSLNLSQG